MTDRRLITKYLPSETTLKYGEKRLKNNCVLGFKKSKYIDMVITLTDPIVGFMQNLRMR